MKKESSIFSAFRKELEQLGNVIMPFLVYYISYFVAAIILTFIVSSLLQNITGIEQDFLPRYEAIINGVIGGAAMLIGILPLWKSFRQEVLLPHKTGEGTTDELGNLERKGIICRYYRGFVTTLLAIASSLSVNILFIMLHLTENSETYKEVAANQYGVPFGLGIFLYGVISPLSEEVVFRGLLYNRMKKIYSVTVSMVLSAFLFGLYHGNLVQGLYGFLMGCLIAYTYERFGNFRYAFCFHAIANITVYIITGAEAVYRMVVTPYNFIIFTVISGILILVMGKRKK